MKGREREAGVPRSNVKVIKVSVPPDHSVGRWTLKFKLKH